MPYYIRNRGGKRPWKIISKETGKVVGTSKTRNDAEASARIRMANHGKKK